MPNWHPVAHESELSDKEVLAIEIAEQSLLLVRSGDAIHAIAARCTHADQDLFCGAVRNGWIACPAHGARFDLATGEPLNPPATEAIDTFPIRVRNGWLEVLLQTES